VLVEGNEQRVWAYHDGVDLGRPAMARIASHFGYTVAELRKLQGDLSMSTLRVELFHDDEAGNWHYRVPALRIIGGGTATRAQAECDAVAAIAFALQGDPRDFGPGAHTVTFDVTVAPAA
jgi:hypothetical protein